VLAVHSIRPAPSMRLEAFPDPGNSIVISPL
jgi:hypothetical protein